MNLPTANGDKKTRGDVDQRMRIWLKTEHGIKQCRQGKTGHNGQDRQHGIAFKMFGRRRFGLEQLGQIWQKNATVAAIGFGRLIGFAAFRAEHNIGNVYLAEIV
ncbi:MAG: hypothetical protein ABIZ95_04910 [Pyrinomonadaceae bacterium]